MLQRYSAAVDSSAEPSLRCFVGGLRWLGGHLDPQHGEAVIVAQLIGQLVEICDHCADGGRMDGLQQPQLMAEVFRLLTPFVQRRVGRRLAYRR